MGQICLASSALNPEASIAGEVPLQKDGS